MILKLLKFLHALVECTTHIVMISLQVLLNSGHLFLLIRSGVLPRVKVSVFLSDALKTVQ